MLPPPFPSYTNPTEEEFAMMPLHRQIAGISERSKIVNAISLARAVLNQENPGVSPSRWAHHILLSFTD